MPLGCGRSGAFCAQGLGVFGRSPFVLWHGNLVGCIDEFKLAVDARFQVDSFYRRGCMCRLRPDVGGAWVCALFLLLLHAVSLCRHWR